MGRIRRRTFDILSPHKEGDRPSQVFDYFLISLISLNVLAVILETVEELSVPFESTFIAFEVASVAFFTIEYVLRIWTATVDESYGGRVLGRLRFVVTPLALIDLAAVLPFYLPAILPLDLRFVRALRLLRIFRLVKIARYSEAVSGLGYVFKARKEELVVSFAIGFVLLLLASSLMFFFENEVQPDSFSSIPSTMWWGVATLTTVGYGDVYPVTAVGKLLSAVLTVLGIGIFAIPTGIVASGFAELLSRRRQEAVCPHCGEPLGDLERIG